MAANDTINMPLLLFCLEVMSDSLRPHELQHARLPCPSLYLLEFAQTHVHWVTDAIQPSRPLSSPSALNLSQHQVFSNELALHIRWPKYWSFSFSISPSNEYSGLISFRTDWLDLLAVQGTSPASQFKGISSLALSLFYCLALTAIHDYWKNHSFDYTDLCRQSNISDF